jgi:hypothetical protein
LPGCQKGVTFPPLERGRGDALFLALALLAQATQPDEPDSYPPREVRLPRPVVEVPLLRISERPAVEVLVDGQGLFRLG